MNPEGILLKSINCGDLSDRNLGERVILSGWVHRRRDHGNLIFIDPVSYTHLTLPTKA